MVGHERIMQSLCQVMHKHLALTQADYIQTEERNLQVGVITRHRDTKQVTVLTANAT